MSEVRILVVDDSAYVRNSLKTLLETSGYTVVAMAENGLDALGKYKSHRPDLVMLDIIMPQMDGLSTLRALHQLDPSARVIMVTSISTRASVMDCVKAGAKNYILKPFDKEKVIEAVQKVVGVRGEVPEAQVGAE